MNPGRLPCSGLFLFLLLMKRIQSQHKGFAHGRIQLLAVLFQMPSFKSHMYAFLL